MRANEQKARCQGARFAETHCENEVVLRRLLGGRRRKDVSDTREAYQQACVHPTTRCEGFDCTSVSCCGREREREREDNTRNEVQLKVLTTDLISPMISGLVCPFTARKTPPRALPSLRCAKVNPSALPRSPFVPPFSTHLSL